MRKDRDLLGNDVLQLERYQEGPPGYELQQLMGRGTFSECWQATHELSGCKVAIKKIQRRRLSVPMLEREIGLWSRLDHPNVVSLFEVCPTADNVYLTMEAAEGGELFRLLAQHPQGFPPAQALDYFVQVVEAVDYLHEQGVAHRDLKLENILLTQDHRTVKLADFGFACDSPRSGNPDCREWLGSPEYSAPEILDNRPYDPIKADCWSLGVILFAMMTGFLPFSSVEDDCGGIKDVERKIRHRVVNSIYEIPPQISPEIAQIIKKLLAADPNQRWGTRTLRRLPLLTGRPRSADNSQASGGKNEKILQSLTISELKGLQRPKFLGAAMALQRILLKNARKDYPQQTGLSLGGTTDRGMQSSTTSPELNQVMEIDAPPSRRRRHSWMSNLKLFPWSNTGRSSTATAYRNIVGRTSSDVDEEDDLSTSSAY